MLIIFIVSFIIVSVFLWADRIARQAVSLQDMSTTDLQLELYFEQCNGRDGVEYMEELDRRGEPHVMMLEGK